MEFKTNSPTIEISPQEIANKIINGILISLKDEIYEMVEERACDELEYIFDVDMDSTNTRDLNDFIYDVYNVVCDNIKENL